MFKGGLGLLSIFVCSQLYCNKIIVIKNNYRNIAFSSLKRTWQSELIKTNHGKCIKLMLLIKK